MFRQTIKSLSWDFATISFELPGGMITDFQ
uniref:Uncharacterized protein n=1 Tax=Rhizophora mucronata TaxID=61149 RepID=A0A2P2NA97_RHIMU